MLKRSIVIDTGLCFGLSPEAHELFLSLSGFKYFECVNDRNKTIFLNIPSVVYRSLRAKANTSTAKAEIDKSHAHSVHTIARDNNVLIEVVNKLKDRANTQFSKLRVVEIDYDATWHIEEKYGSECVVITKSRVPISMPVTPPEHIENDNTAKCLPVTSVFPLCITPTQEQGAGSAPLTISMAANAIWNKLNVGMSLVAEEGQLMQLLGEARALAEAIVHYPFAKNT